MAKLTYHFYLKDKNTINLTPINLHFGIGNFRKKIAIGESIFVHLWDIDKERAIISSSESRNNQALAKRVNRAINKLCIDLDDLFEEYSGISQLSPNHTEGYDLLHEFYIKVKDIVEGNISEEKEEARSSRITPIEFFNDFVDKWAISANKRTGRVPQQDTIWNYRNTIRRYSDYIHDSGLKDSFRLFNEDFAIPFDDYLRNEQELSNNSICATHSQLKTMLRRAYEKGLLKDSSFLNWSSKAVNINHVYLNDEELKRIYNLEFTDKFKAEHKISDRSRIEETRDLFIIASRTGLRFGDISRLEDAEWDFEERLLGMTISKTYQTIHIPLHDEVIAIYEKYKGNLPKAIDKSHYNEQVRLCAKLAGITQIVPTWKWKKGTLIPTAAEKWELIASHTARRSFATNLFLSCKKAEYVMPLTGHTTEANFKRYICVDQKQMAILVRQYINLDYREEVDEFFEKFIATIKADTLTIEAQKEMIEKQKREKANIRVQAAISEGYANVQEGKIKEMIEFWRDYGFTYEQYEEVMKQESEHAGMIDSMGTDAMDLP